MSYQQGLVLNAETFTILISQSVQVASMSIDDNARNAMDSNGNQ